VPPLNMKSLIQVSELPAVDGASSTRYESLTGKPLLVTFFASWCPPCLKEFSHLNKLHKNYQHTDLRIIAINVYEEWDDNDQERMKKFITTTDPLFPAVVGSERIRELFGGIGRILTVYGFDRNGDHVYRFIHRKGAKKTNASYEKLAQAADKLLGR